MKSVVTLMAVISTLAVTVFAEEIIGVSWPNDIYRIDSTTGTGSFVGSPAFTSLNSMAKDLTGKMYTVDGSSNLIVINPSTGAGTKVATVNLGAASVTVPSMAFSPSGTLYVVNRSGGADSLYTIDVSTGVGALVGPAGPGRILQGLAFAPNGTLYAWDIFGGLYTVNTTTGAATDVNPSEGASANIQCLAFSPDGILYGAQYGLYTINTATGVPSAISTSGLSDIRGIEFNSGPVLRLTIEKITLGTKLSWFAATNTTYQLQVRTNLSAAGAWVDSGPQRVGMDNYISVTNTTVGLSRFYQVKTVLP